MKGKFRFKFFILMSIRSRLYPYILGEFITEQSTAALKSVFHTEFMTACANLQTRRDDGGVAFKTPVVVHTSVNNQYSSMVDVGNHFSGTGNSINVSLSFGHHALPFVLPLRRVLE